MPKGGIPRHLSTFLDPLLRVRNSPSDLVDGKAFELVLGVGVKDRPIRRNIATKKTVPIGVQRHHLPGCRNHLFRIAAGIAIRTLPRVASAAMQRLMRVANEMQNPNEIIGANIIRCARACRQRGDHQFWLRYEVNRILRRKRRSVRRPVDVLVVPIGMLVLIRMANVLAGRRAVARITIFLGRDVIGPGRGMDKRVKLGGLRGP